MYIEDKHYYIYMQIVDISEVFHIFTYLYTTGFYIIWLSVSMAEWLMRLTFNAKAATVLGSIPASSDTVESEDEAV
jgi:hypothetical protein